MLKKISNIVKKNSTKIVVSIILNKKTFEYEVYKINQNNYTKKEINAFDWSDLEYLENLSWEEIKDISSNLHLVDKNELDYWMEKNKKSYKYKFLKNFYKIIF